MRLKEISRFSAILRILGHELAGICGGSSVHGVTGLAIGDQVSVVPYMHCGNCIACRNGKTNCCTDMKVLGVHIDGGMRELISLASHPSDQDGWPDAGSSCDVGAA